MATTETKWAPTTDGGCSYDDCPEYDGKRCSLTGSQPSRGCSPAFTEMRDVLRGVLRWYALLPEPGAVPGGAELHQRLREASALLATLGGK